MADRVGAFIQRSVAGPLALGPDPGDTFFVALTAQRGPSDVPTFISSFSRFRAQFGEATPFADGTRYSAGYEVLQAFFNKGGRRAVVLRLTGAAALAAHVDLLNAVTPCLRVTAKGEGTWANAYQVQISAGTRAGTFKLKVLDGDGLVLEAFDNITMTDDALAKVSDASSLVTLEGLTTDTPDNGTFNLNTTQAGVDDNAPATADIVGTEVLGVKTGLKTLRDRRMGRGILVVPDLDTAAEVRDEMRLQTEEFFRVALTSSAEGMTPTAAVTDKASAAAFNIGYYYPRVKAVDALTGGHKTYPVVGHVAADWLKAIDRKGPAKAPAGKDFRIDFALGIEAQPNGQPLVDEGVAELLVGNGINPIWDRDGTGPKVWGGRTTSEDPNWLYMHDAYLWCRVAQAAQALLDRETYEVGGELLFTQIRGGMRQFMSAEHALGAYHGTIPLDGEDPSATHAFFVKCDETLMSDADKNNGIIRMEVWFKSALTAETLYARVAKRNHG